MTTRDPITMAAALVLLGLQGCCDCGGPLLVGHRPNDTRERLALHCADCCDTDCFWPAGA